MKHLVGLTESGLTVVASIHQPRQEIFESLDKVAIFSEGHQLFLAPPAFALPWFHRVLGFPYDADVDGTVADWLITTVSLSFRKNQWAAARSVASLFTLEFYTKCAVLISSRLRTPLFQCRSTTKEVYPCH